MKALIIFGTIIILCLGCSSDEEGDGAVLILSDAEEPYCGPGNLIVFTRGDIFYCDANGRNVKRVTNTRDTHEQNPYWSPDGEYIAYHGFDPWERSGGIFVVPKGGGEPTQLTIDGGDRPAWSPDGLTIVYNDPRDYDIWTVGAGGGEPRRLTEKGDCISPCWSPDGERIYFAGRDPKAPKGPCFLWYIDVGTGRTVRLWRYDDHFGDLAIRPDGEWLAATFSEDYASQDIWLIEVKTGKRYRLTNEPEPDYGGD
jgi:Tol biopolymer transport system component